MNRIKIAVIGSCASRDNFNHNFVPNYKDYFQCIVSQNQMSIISLMADPIPFDADKISGNVSDFAKHHFISELEKSVIYHLLINEPDYLVLDFYADVFYGARRVSHSFITNKVWQFKKINIYKELDIGQALSVPKEKQSFFTFYKYWKNEKMFMKIWKRNVDRFVKFMRDYLPNCKIVINKSRFTNRYYDKENNKISLITEKLKQNYDIDRLNKMWSRLDSYFINKYSVRSIDFGDEKYLADPDNPWGLFYLHFEKKHYLDFRDKLLKIVYDDRSKNLKKRERVNIRSVNLIKNSTFNIGKKYWTYWQYDFVIQQESSGANSVSLQQRNNKQDAICQIWSNAVEINADGTSDYTLSFEIRVNNTMGSEQVIFSLRLYDKEKNFSQKDMVIHKNLYLHQFHIANNEWTRCSYTFRPPKGKFIKVGPSLSGNGSLKWRKIQLEKGDKATPWKLGYREK